MLSSANTGGSFEATGYGYGPGIGEGYEQCSYDRIRSIRLLRLDGQCDPATRRSCKRESL